MSDMFRGFGLTFQYIQLYRARLQVQGGFSRMELKLKRSSKSGFVTHKRFCCISKHDLAHYISALSSVRLLQFKNLKMSPSGLAVQYSAHLVHPLWLVHLVLPSSVPPNHIPQEGPHLSSAHARSGIVPQVGSHNSTHPLEPENGIG